MKEAEKVMKVSGSRVILVDHKKHKIKALTIEDYNFLGSKITADGDCSHEIKRRLLP